MLLPQGLSLDAERLIDKITEDSVNPGFVYVYLDEKEDEILLKLGKTAALKRMENFTYPVTWLCRGFMK